MDGVWMVGSTHRSMDWGKTSCSKRHLTRGSTSSGVACPQLNQGMQTNLPYIWQLLGTFVQKTFKRARSQSLDLGGDMEGAKGRASDGARAAPS